LTECTHYLVLNQLDQNYQPVGISLEDYVNHAVTISPM